MASPSSMRGHMLACAQWRCLVTQLYWSSFSEIITFPYSSALNRYREFLNSTLLRGMYCDALASGDVDFATSVPPQSIKKLLSCSASPVHISRIDAFATVMQALANAVCRYMYIYGFVMFGAFQKPWRSGTVSKIWPTLSSKKVLHQLTTRCHQLLAVSKAMNKDVQSYWRRWCMAC